MCIDPNETWPRSVSVLATVHRRESRPNTPDLSFPYPNRAKSMGQARLIGLIQQHVVKNRYRQPLCAPAPRAATGRQKSRRLFYSKLERNPRKLYRDRPLRTQVRHERE